MPQLNQIYDELAAQPENGQFGDAVFRLVDALILEIGEEGIADKVIDATPLAVPWSQIANILGIMIWSTTDNGADGIVRAAESWLVDGRDERRAFVALHLDVYPFKNPSQMKTVLEHVSSIYPSLAAACAAMISSREKANSGRCEPFAAELTDLEGKSA
ncbi:MAG: hypothetical protein U1F71_01590 [Verrucomicrobiaceae bacterium]